MRQDGSEERNIVDEQINIKDSKFKIKNSIPRFINQNSASQQQTSDTFGYKWKKRDTFENNVNKHMEFWLNERYGEIKECFLNQFNLLVASNVPT